MVPLLNSPSIKCLSLDIGRSLFSQDPMMLSECESLQKLEIGGEIKVQFQPEMFPKSLVNLIFSYTNLRQDPMPILEHRLPLLKKLRVWELHRDWNGGWNKEPCPNSGPWGCSKLPTACRVTSVGEKLVVGRAFCNPLEWNGMEIPGKGSPRDEDRTEGENRRPASSQSLIFFLAGIKSKAFS
ncbi:hypothetical protein Dimus_023516 [Dionaea muscipula]